MSQPFFREIIGHEKIQEVLERSVEHDRLAHAYLFVGPEGVGKTAVAEAFMSAVMLQSKTPPSPPLVRGGKSSHPDVQFVSRLTDEKTGKQKTAISVQQIRALTERLGMSAMSGGYKAVFIEDADALRGASANALLKTLEEPRGDTLIILRASHVESVPATIASRCQVLRFGLVGRGTIALALEKRGLIKVDAQRLAALAIGRPGHAIRLYQDTGFAAERETAATSFLNALGQSIPERLGMIADMLPKDEVNKAQEAVRRLGAWEMVLRDLLLYSAGQGELGVLTGEEKRVAGIAGRMKTPRIIRALGRLRESRESLGANVHPQLALEHVLLDL